MKSYYIIRRTTEHLVEIDHKAGTSSVILALEAAAFLRRNHPATGGLGTTPDGWYRITNMPDQVAVDNGRRLWFYDTLETLGKCMPESCRVCKIYHKCASPRHSSKQCLNKWLAECREWIRCRAEVEEDVDD